MQISPDEIKAASQRIAGHINRTPLVTSSVLNKHLCNEIYFKVEGLQKIGAFKFRGAINALLKMQETNSLPREVVTFSSGNHAQAIALSAKILGIKATVFVPATTSRIKIQATESYGAEVVVTNTRQEAEQMARDKQQSGAYFLPPYDHDDIIAGQGTACYEILADGLRADAIFATCGGGGWLSGTYLAKELLLPSAKVIAAEPAIANDAAQSYRAGKIIALETSPQTIADGARTLAISERTFQYLKKLDGFIEVSEQEIIIWTQWLMHLLKNTVEPTSAAAMAAVHLWIQKENIKNKKILVMLSGGNISPETYRQIWEVSYLDNMPKL